MRITLRKSQKASGNVTGVGLGLVAASVAVVVVAVMALVTVDDARSAQPEQCIRRANGQLVFPNQHGARQFAGRGAPGVHREFPEMGTEQEGLELVSARDTANALVCTGVSPVHSRVQALEWIAEQGGILATDTETGGLILTLENNPELGDITPLIALPEISSLHISSEGDLDLSPLVGLQELRSLTLHNSPGLRNVTSLAGLVKLRTLRIYCCSNLYDLSGLASLENLEELQVTYSDISDLSPLAHLSKLRVLRLYGCQQVFDVSSLAILENLREAHFEACMNLEDVSTLEALPNLELLVTRFQGC